MDISLSGVVRLIIFLLVAGGVFGLLFWLIKYIGTKVPPESKPFIDVAQIILVVCAVLVLIGILLSFVGVVPAIRFVQ